MDNYSESDTDNEYYDSWNETDNEDESIDFIYEPEELSLSKLTIVLCEKYNKNLHGSAPKIMNQHFLTYIRFKQFNMDIINVFKNNSNNLKLEIAECIYLLSDHCVSIIKTFWIKLIQRKWKNILKERKLCISRRSNPNALKYREIYGKWPNNCRHYPNLKGSLYELSRTTSRTTFA
jgi:hypothetical protein